MDKLKLEEQFVITPNFISEESKDYSKEVQLALKRTKYLFPQLCLFADNAMKSICESSTISRSQPIESYPISFQPYRFELYPKDQESALQLLRNINSNIQTPIVLDFLLHANYLHDTFPLLSSSLNELYYHIYTENKIPIVQLALISHLFSIPSLRIDDLFKLFLVNKIDHPGKIVTCILTDDQTFLPLSLDDPLFEVSEDSFYLYFHKHEYVFSPSKKVLQYRKKGKHDKINKKVFSAFLNNADTETVESIGIINNQLYFAQKIDNKNLRISTFQEGILSDHIQRKENILTLNSNYATCKFFKNHLMIFFANGKKGLYDVQRNCIIKNPYLSNFYFDFSDISIYDVSNDSFILVTQDGDNLLYEVIPHQKARSSFMQILPPCYGPTTDELISRVSFELLNLSTDILSSLVDTGSYQDTQESQKAQIVSNPLIHIDYALDLADIVLNNQQQHDEKLCDFCLIAITRFLIVNIYQLYASKDCLASHQMNRITRLFSSMKITYPHFDTLFSMISVINHGIYTNNFISQVLHHLFPLLGDSITKNIIQSLSFIFFINKESIQFMDLKDKMNLIQSKAGNLINIYSEINSDQAFNPFMTVFFDVLNEAIITKSVSNAAVCSYFASIIPFLCTMDNTPQLSMFILKQLIKYMEPLTNRIRPVISQIDKMFSRSSLDHFQVTKTTKFTLENVFAEENEIRIDDINSAMGFENSQFISNTFYHQQLIFNEAFDFLNNWTNSDFLIYLLPNAIMNCIEICYKSIEITRTEEENKRFIDNQAPSNDLISTCQEEKDFLNQLDENSIIIKRLRKEVRYVLKKSEEIEILIFKALLYQTRIVDLAQAVSGTSSIDPIVIAAWKLSIKIRSDLLLSRQHAQNKKIIHTNLNERYSEYLKSIQEKCQFLLAQKVTENIEDKQEWMKLNYTFITSNLLLSDLNTLSKIAQARKEIKEYSITALKTIIQMKIPNSFRRSIISYVFKNRTLKEVLKGDEEFIQILLMSKDPFNRLSVFDCINEDRYQEIADYMLYESQENDETVLSFLDIFLEDEEESNEESVESLLQIIGQSSYKVMPNATPYQRNEYMKNVQEKETTLQLISRIKDIDDISLGVLQILDMKESFTFEESKLIVEQLSLIQDKISSQSNYMILNMLIVYFNLLSKLLTSEMHEINCLVKEKIDLTKFTNIPNPETNFKELNADTQYLLLDILREIKEKQNEETNDERPGFIQLKGNSLPDAASTKITTFVHEVNFYSFSKPIDGTENITIKIKDNAIDSFSPEFKCCIIGIINMHDQYQTFIENEFNSEEGVYFTDDPPTKFYIYKNPETNKFTFMLRNAFDYPDNEFAGIDGPVIPFILTIGCKYEMTYTYSTQDNSQQFGDPIELQIRHAQTCTPISQYTIIPQVIVGSKVNIENVGDGVVIKTNDKNDDVTVSLLTKNHALALINSTLDNFHVIPENLFLTLLRSLTIVAGYNNSDLIENFLSSSANTLCSRSYQLCLLFNGDFQTLITFLSTEYLLKYALSKFKPQLIKVINQQLSTIIETQKNELKCLTILSNLINNNLIENPFQYILLLIFNTSTIIYQGYIEETASKIDYSVIEYDVSNIDFLLSCLSQLIEYELIVDDLMEINSFRDYFKDFVSFLFDHAYPQVNSIFENAQLSIIDKLIYSDCMNPKILSKFTVFAFYHYPIRVNYSIDAFTKFKPSLPCINLRTNERLEPGNEYQFDRDTTIRIIKPDDKIQADQLLQLVNSFNENSIDKYELFVWMNDNYDHLYSIEKYNLSPEIIYLYLIIFEILKQFPPLFVLRTLPEKLKYIRRAIKMTDQEAKLTFSRINNRNGILIFDQFCSQIGSNFQQLRNMDAFRANFQREGGIDAGGPRREAITLIYKELIDPNNKVFEFDQDGFLIPFHKCNFKRLKCAGAFIATCLISNNPRDFHLSPKIWELFIIHQVPKDYDESYLALKEGFNAVIPENGIELCIPSDIRNLTCGDDFTMEKLISKCDFYNSDIKETFITAISSFTIDQLKQFLRFATGTETLPFDPEFRIHIHFESINGADEANWPLPVAHTCFKSIDIAPYTDPVILANKIRLAMYTFIISDNDPDFEGISFDAL